MLMLSIMAVAQTSTPDKSATPPDQSTASPDKSAKPADQSATADKSAAPADKKDKAAKAPLKNLTGTVKADGDKLSFVNDKDQKSWDVMNPEELKGHEGHHVKVQAHVYSDKNSIHVMKVSMVPEKASKKEKVEKQ
jgi:hypothetical protein